MVYVCLDLGSGDFFVPRGNSFGKNQEMAKNGKGFDKWYGIIEVSVYI